MRSGASLWDAIVVGSGPAGATAALHLARRNLQVLILEKGPWPRYKTCGGGLVWRARRQLELPIQETIEDEAQLAELHLHDAGASFSVSRSQPLVSMTMRSAFDDALTAGALRAGAQLRTSCTVTAIDRLSDCVNVATSDRSFRARYLIAADGATGPSARLAGWTRHRRLIPALESELRVDRATRERFRGVARFDFGLVPAGYAWVFPKKKHLSVGCLSWQGPKSDLKRHLAAYLQRLEFRPLDRDDHGFVIPVAPRSSRLAANRVLLVGDSAGLADPVTCEGISNAILSGRLVAAAIAEQLPSPETVVSNYLRSLEFSVLGELRWARVLARMLYLAPRLRRFAFRRLGYSLTDAMAEIISGDRTYRQLLTRPGSYWRTFLRLLGRATTHPKG